MQRSFFIAMSGLLAITCTDKAVLCGNHSEAGWAKYGCMPLRGPYCHEMVPGVVDDAFNRTACKAYEFTQIFCCSGYSHCIGLHHGEREPLSQIHRARCV